MSRPWRLGAEILGLCVALAVLSVVVRGLAPVMPALAGVARVLLNPFVLVSAVVFVLLFRSVRRSKRADSAPHDGPGATDPDRE